jgi:ABC-type transport system involved in multi-copper enzyme maturation permease subunit
MYKKKVILLKEILDLLKSERRSIFLQVSFVFFLSIFLPMNITNSLNEGIDSTLLSVSLYTVLSIIFCFSFKLFLIERMDKTLVTLLTTPINFNDIILGKSFFLMVLAIPLSLIIQTVVSIYLIGIRHLSFDLIQVVGQILIQTILVTPIFILALSSAIGFLVFKAKNNRIANLVGLIPIFIFLLVIFLLRNLVILKILLIFTLINLMFFISIQILIKYALKPENIVAEKFNG